MNITDVNKRVKAHRQAKRLGRGAASGLGKTAGRGQKGYYSRSGAGGLKGFVGGQTPLRQRLPKRGFNNKNFRTEYIPVNLAFLEKQFDSGAEVCICTLSEAGIKIGRGAVVKILGTGELSKGLTVKAHAFSKSAQEKIEKAGGKVEVLPAPKMRVASKDKEAKA